MSITLRHYADGDLALSLALETDPVAMAELGGPRDREGIVRVHASRVTEIHSYVLDEDGDGLGFIGAWPTDHDDRPIHETGWMVLPRAHGRGVATAGLTLLLDAVRTDAAIASLHAFPGAANVASGRLCDRFGFADLGPVEVDFGDARLHCRHRVLDLQPALSRAARSSSTVPAKSDHDV